ncbi:TIGR03758 family integrating conjugative element protein [Rodentibacter caecimuris]|uniref:Integrating conjugative element protein n=1 Tax=Rodentibacter caecimuris TaxID=1796644 RepID=A0AAJ3K509_9PAST|nr:TIGR03758 family integrating conjugative element protein [Rodentibacter heylii]MCX2960983.1 TIGR03758 family integrating conjugative element protein [Rodentibacter heylii]OOF72443.1 integrating conjugative element protein [Rodentibacter heylii]OOF76871.1 integrating conjugative element protein [Rodentibacter heylii]
MSDKSSVVQNAFKAGSGATPDELHILIIGLIFVSVFLVLAYIWVNAFKDLREGNMKMSTFGGLIVRGVLFFCIMGYFLLR